MRFFRVVCVILLCGVFVSSVFASQDVAVPEAVKARMRVYEALGVKVLGYVPGPGNLVGVVCRVPEKFLTLPMFRGQAREDGSQNVMFFLSPDGRYMVVGMVFDLDRGVEYVTQVLAQYGDEAGEGDVLDLKLATVSELEGLSWVADGEGGDRLLYCFVDVRCPHSAREFGELHGKVPVRWVPVTNGDPVSITRTAFFLGGENRSVEVLAELFGKVGKARLSEVFWNFSAEEKRTLAKGVMELEKNMDFAKRYGIESTPVCLVVDRGRIARIYRGYFGHEFILQGQK